MVITPLLMYEELNDNVGMATNYTNTGIVLNDMGNLKEALDYLKMALSIHEELNDKVGMARDYGNIGNVLRNMGNHEEALESVSKGLTILQEFEKKTGYHHPLIEGLQVFIAKLIA